MNRTCTLSLLLILLFSITIQTVIATTLEQEQNIYYKVCSPSQNETIIAGWNNPVNAYSEDMITMYSGTNNSTQSFFGFNFDLVNVNIISLKIEYGFTYYVYDVYQGAFTSVYNWFDFWVYNGSWIKYYQVNVNQADATTYSFADDLTVYGSGKGYIKILENFNETMLNNIKIAVSCDFFGSLGGVNIAIDFIRLVVVYSVASTSILNELFFGESAFIGFLIILVICSLLGYFIKYFSVIGFVILMLLGYQYMIAFNDGTKDFMWLWFLAWISGIILILQMIVRLKR